MAIDIQLLRVVQALARCRSVTAAAATLGLTQSTVSHALGRLREHYADPLFVRAGRQLSLTPLARTLEKEAERLLVDFDRVQLLSETFDPQQSSRRFKVHMIDLAELMLLPRLLRLISQQELRVEIEVVRVAGSEVWAELESGSIDLVIGTPWKVQPSLYHQRLMDEQCVGIARVGHPLSKKLESVTGYLRACHCVIRPRGPALGRIEAALAALSPARRVVLEVPDFLSVPSLVAHSDLVAAVPLSLLSLHPEGHLLQTFQLPIARTRFAVVQHWHERLNGDAANRWLRATLHRQVAERRQSVPFV